jgi:hypothetical protein
MRGDRLASILAFVAQVFPAGAAGAQASTGRN